MVAIAISGSEEQINRLNSFLGLLQLTCLDKVIASLMKEF
jgi:hypothetical protein